MEDLNNLTPITEREAEIPATVEGAAGEVAVRPVEVITAEIWAYKQQAGYAILEIGRRLNEAKEQLTHGEWLPWLKEKVEFSEVTAQRFMRLAREYTNPSTVTDLGASKALTLLALPASERDEFLTEKHTVKGEEKTAFEMSNTELAAVIKERDEARRRAEDAEKALAEQLEEQRTVYDVDMAGLRGQLEEANNRAAGYEEKLKQAREKAEQDAAAAQEEAEALREELAALKEAPAEVAVEPTVDQAAIDAAAAEAKAHAEAQLKAKIERAEKAKEKAEQAKAKAEGDLAALKVAQEQAAAIAEQEKQALADQVQTLQKKLAMASSSETTIFKLYFDQTQDNLNKMAECMARMAEAGDADGADRLKAAFNALLDAAREVVGGGGREEQTDQDEGVHDEKEDDGRAPGPDHHGSVRC